MKSSQRGFTFIEILVVTILIGVLTSILVVSYSSASKFTRDARRKKDLANIQAALELYKVQNQQYPDSSDCSGGSGWTWPGCMDPWISGLSAEYMAELPVDPRQNVESVIVNDTNLSEPTYTYNYIRLTPSTYYLIARMENVDDVAINGDDYSFTGNALYVVVEPK